MVVCRNRSHMLPQARMRMTIAGFSSDEMIDKHFDVGTCLQYILSFFVENALSGLAI